MKSQFMCPACHRELVNTQTGFVCEEHGQYDLANGIVRFLGGHEFDSHWLRNLATEIAQPKIDLAYTFLAPLSGSVGKDGCRILDAGCGDGVHAYVLSNFFATGKCQAYGIDASVSALNAAQGRVGDNWTFAEADLGKLPFADDFFDVVYAFGSIEYTDSPEKTLNELCRVLRPGGKLQIWMLPPPSGLTGVALAILRTTAQILGPLGARLIADAIVPLLQFLPNQTGLNLKNASWRQCREAVLVNVASSQLTTVHPEHVTEWLSLSGMMLEKELTGITGVQLATKMSPRP